MKKLTTYKAMELEGTKEKIAVSCIQSAYHIIEELQYLEIPLESFRNQEKLNEFEFIEQFKSDNFQIIDRDEYKQYYQITDLNKVYKYIEEQKTIEVKKDKLDTLIKSYEDTLDDESFRWTFSKVYKLCKNLTNILKDDNIYEYFEDNHYGFDDEGYGKYSIETTSLSDWSPIKYKNKNYSGHDLLKVLGFDNPFNDLNERNKYFWVFSNYEVIVNYNLMIKDFEKRIDKKEVRK